MISTAAQEESRRRPLPWNYQEEPDAVPAEEPAQTTPAPAPTPPNPYSAPPGHLPHGHPMPWDYQEEPDIAGGAS
jgi:hypothetical protein